MKSILGYLSRFVTTFNSLNKRDFDMYFRDMVAAVILQLVLGAGISASPITLDQALVEALTNNKELQAKSMAVKTAESERLKARLWSTTNPELELEAVSDVLTANSGEGTLRLGLSQEIELGGQRGQRTKIADAHIQIARLEAIVAESALRRDVKTSFYSLLLVQQRLSFALFADSLATVLRDSAAVRVKGGFLPVSELTFLDIDVAISRSTIQKVEVALSEARNQLLFLLGGVADSSLEAVGELMFQPLNTSEENVVSLALANRPELQEIRVQQSATSAALRLSRSERVPNLRVSAFYSRERSVFSKSNFSGTNTGIQGLRDTDHLFGIRLSLPLSLIDKRHAEIALFTNVAKVDSVTSQSLESQIRYEARSAFKALKSTDLTLEILKKILPESDSLFRLLQTAYSQGRVTVADYLAQKDRLFNMRLNLQDAFAARIAAQNEFERAVGLDWNQLELGEKK